MSSPNAPSASTSSNAKSSRFSTLKVFGKFGGSNGGAKGRGGADEGLRPPPLPPKDPYYLSSNRSVASLSPESVPGSPMTPLSAAAPFSNIAGNNQNLLQIQYARRQGTGYLHPGSSSLSLVSSTASAVDTPSDGVAGSPSQQKPMEGEQGQGQGLRPMQRKKSGFFPKFGRRAKSPSIRSGSGDESMLSPEFSAGQDENISMPWNFQHNIHVDEAYGGMPPSWTISLAEAGFTEAEIAAIYARKQAGTLGNSYSNERPRSPALSSISSSPAASTSIGYAQPRPKTSLSTSSSSVSISNMNSPAPVLARPSPRSTSLPRQYSNNSLRSNPSSSSVPVPNLPTPFNPVIGKKIIATPALPSHSRSRKNSSSTSSLSISVDGNEVRMRPNVVAEQGDGPVEQGVTSGQHRRDLSGGSGGPTTTGHRSNGSLGRNPSQKSSPLSIRPPININGSPTDNQGPNVSSASTPPRRYHVVNTQSPPPPYGGNVETAYDLALDKKDTIEDTPTAARQGSQEMKRNSRRRSKRIFPVGGSISSNPSSSSNPDLARMSSSSSSPSSSPKMNRSATVRSSNSGHSQHSSRGSNTSVKPNKQKLSYPRVDLKLDGLGLGSLGFDLDLGLDNWSESVIKEATPTSPEFSENRWRPSGSGSSGSSRQGEKSSKTSYGSSLGTSSPRPPQPTRAAPPVIYNSSTTSSPSSFSLTYSPVITVESGSSPSLSVQSFSQPLASPSSPFPRSPSPGTAMSDALSSAPLGSALSLSPSPHTGLFEEIREMLAPGALTGGGLNSQGRVGQKNARREKDKSPIQRIRGDNYEDEENEGNQNEECEEEWEEDGDRWTGPALSETHSPILPLSPPATQQQQGAPNNRVSAYRLQDRDKMQQAITKAGAQVVGQADARSSSDHSSQPSEDVVEEVTDDGFLTADGARYSSSSVSNRNRNSSRSSTSTVSTVTVTQLTATTTIVKRAVATKIGVPGTGKAADDTASLHAPGSSVSPVPSRSTTPSLEPVPTSSSRSTSPAPSGHQYRPYVPPPLPAPPMRPTPPPAALLGSPTVADFMARSKASAVNGSIRSKSPHPASPQSSHFDGSEEDSASASTSTGGSGSGSLSLGSGASSLTSASTSPTVDVNEDEAELVYYLDNPRPGQAKDMPDRKEGALHEHHRFLTSTSDTFGGVCKEDIPTPSDEGEEYEDEEVVISSPVEAEGATRVTRSPTLGSGPPVPVPPTLAYTMRPTIVISSSPIKPGPITAAMASSTTPVTPAPRYRGWLSEVVKPLEEFIDEPIDPREYYLALQEIAEGESGSVYAARVSDTANLNKLKLPPLVKAQDVENQTNCVPALVAIKSVAILPSGSTKLDELRKELVLLKGLMHVNILGMDALYVDLVEDSLWIRMELMERSLADVVCLYEEGLMLQERVIARFASDILEALKYLHTHNIAHRDVRSDNLLLNNQGVLKLADFSNAVRVPKSSPMVSEPVGVPYWQAPEVRNGSYNALKVDVWSLGATVWEMAQAEPPFANSSEPGDRWPPLRKPEIYSPAFHEFLHMCSEPSSTRPDPQELAENSFVSNSCGRPVIVQLLQQCMAIEKLIQEREDSEELDS